jgi:hypothetical protein
MLTKKHKAVKIIVAMDGDKAKEIELESAFA